MHTFAIIFHYQGGETETMHMDALHRTDAFHWAATVGLQETKYYSGLVRSIEVDAA